MTVVVYRSTDASAPTLSGTIGDLITVLNAVLVNGYGSKAAAGWTSPFTGTNGAVYKQGSGAGFYMLINDNGPGAGTAQEARIMPSEACTAYSATGASSTNRFPTTAQATNGLFIRKSAAASAVTRPWIIVADAKTMYMFVLTGDTAGSYMAWSFGDFTSYLAGDIYNCQVTARATENSATLSVDNLDLITSLGSPRLGSYYARAYTGTGGPQNFATMGARLTSTTASTAGPSQIVYPNAEDGAVYAHKVLVGDSVGGSNLRGEFRGLWMLAHAISFVIDGDAYTATSGTLSGKSFTIVKQSGNSFTYLMETSNTWP